VSPASPAALTPVLTHLLQALLKRALDNTRRRWNCSVLLAVDLGRRPLVAAVTVVAASVAWQEY